MDDDPVNPYAAPAAPEADRDGSLSGRNRVAVILGVPIVSLAITGAFGFDPAGYGSVVPPVQ